MSPRLHKAGRYHLARRPINHIVQRPWVQGREMKPAGFWYGIGDAWLQYMMSDGVPLHDVYTRHVHALRLDHSRILRLTTVPEILAFNAKYRDDTNTYHGTMWIDWRKVERDFAGIEIAPYQHSIRYWNEVGWYYSWDVASGCLWDVDVIKSVEYRGWLGPPVRPSLYEMRQMAKRRWRIRRRGARR